MFTALSSTIKMGLLCALIGLLGVATTYGAWKWQGANIVSEVKKAEDAKDEQIKQERADTKKWRDKATALTAAADAKKTQAKVVHATATQVIKQERAVNPTFYEQEVPAGGAAQWEAARNLMR